MDLKRINEWAATPDGEATGTTIAAALWTAAAIASREPAIAIMAALLTIAAIIATYLATRHDKE